MAQRSPQHIDGFSRHHNRSMPNSLTETCSQPVSAHKLRTAARQLRYGRVIAYPTEAVYGLGCDPTNIDAVQSILDIKGRPAAKGLILIGADFEQLLPYIDLEGIRDLPRVLDTWPGPVTWIIKARPDVPAWLRGTHNSVAVRVTAHPLAARLAKTFGKPLVSTSANPNGRPPARSALRTRRYFCREKIFIIPGSLGGELNTTAIFDAQTNARLR
jgi:L-threonylcarbamoyladenylate synthase